MEHCYAVLGLRQIFLRDVFLICQTCKLHTMYSNQGETETIVVFCLHHDAARGYKNAVRSHNTDILVIFRERETHFQVKGRPGSFANGVFSMQYDFRRLYETDPSPVATSECRNTSVLNEL